MFFSTRIFCFAYPLVCFTGSRSFLRKAMLRPAPFPFDAVTYYFSLFFELTIFLNSPEAFYVPGNRYSTLIYSQMNMP